MLLVPLLCAHCWGCDGHKHRPKKPQPWPGPVVACGEGCPCPGRACLGQVLSAWLAQEPGRASWLPALFADPILFPCSGRADAGQADAGQAELSTGARVASPCSRLL